MTTTMKRGRAKKRSLLRWIAFFLLSISVLARAKSVSDDDDKDDDDWSPMRRAKAAVASNEAKVEEEENTNKRVKSIDVRLSAEFSATSHVLESIELVSDLTSTSSEQFWSYTETWSNQNALNGKRCQRLIEKGQERFVDEIMYGVASVAKGLRLSAPRLEMFKQLKYEALREIGIGHSGGSEECCFATVGKRKRFAYDEERLKAMIREEIEDDLNNVNDSTTGTKSSYSYLVPTEFDHIYPSGDEHLMMRGTEGEERENDEKKPLVYFYAATGSQCFLDMHKVLSNKTQENEIRYVLRPVLEKACLKDQKTVKQCTAYGAYNFDGDKKDNSDIFANEDNQLLRIPGFGVELAIKNMEYKAVDDQITSEKDQKDDDVVLGFDFKTMRERFPHNKDVHEKLDQLKEQFIIEEKSSDDIFQPLPKWKIANLGLLATQKIVSANDPLSMLRDVTQNFPSLMNKMANTMRVQKKTRMEVKENQQAVPPSAVIMSLNGQPLELDTVDAFAITDRVISELKDAERLRQLGLDESGAAETLHIRPKNSRRKDPPKVNASFYPVEYSYDFEKDTQFSKWTSSYSKFLSAIMQSQGQGLPPIRRNIINIVAIVNIGTAEGMEIISGLERYRKMNMPVRYAIIVVGSNDPDQSFEDDDYMGDGAGQEILDDSIPDGKTFSNLVAKCAHYILALYGPKPMRAFVNEIIEGREQLAAGDYFSPPVMAPPKWEDARSTFVQIARSLEVERALKADKWDIINVPADVRKQVTEKVVLEMNDVLDKFEEDEKEENKEVSQFAVQAKSAIESRGLKANSVLINGVYHDADTTMKTIGASISRAMGHLIGGAVQTLQQAIHTKQLKDDMDAYTFVNKGGAKKLRPEIQDESQFPPKFLAEIPHLFYVSKPWLESGVQDEVKPVSIWVVANPDCELGKQQLSEAMKFVLASYGEEGESSNAAKQTRFFLINPQMSDSSKPTKRARAIAAASQLKKKRENVPFLIQNMLEEGDVNDDFIKNAALDAEIDWVEFNQLLANDEVIDAVLQLQRTINVKHLGSTRRAIIVNGRLLDPVLLKTEFDASDLLVLTEDDLEKRANDAKRIVEKDANSKVDLKDHTTKMPPRVLSARVAALSHFIAKRFEMAASRGVVESLEFLSTNYTAFTVKNTTENATVPLVEIEVILDPLSKEAQRIAPVLKVLKDSLGERASLKVIMNPVEKLSNVPLSSYFRYCAQDLKDWSKTPKVMFEAGSLPESKTLTAHLDHPEPWMATTKKAKYDLDNLILENVKEDVVFAEYSLESLLVTGHAFDVSNPRNPPRGTQIVLQKNWLDDEDKKTNVVAGTIIMANLGYFQLPASPGRFALVLKEGRSRQIYEIPDVNLINIDDRTNTFSSRRMDLTKSRAEVTVSSWSGKRVEMKLRKKAGFETADVLSEDENNDTTEQNSLSSKLSSLFGKSGKKNVVKVNENGLETIHIFSVATGHLYERFLKIMMASVRRNTKNLLKFWFIKNWLSPSFKDFLPHFAEKYNIEYELITYKWPTWLHKQTEKQRIIWAYKILFLDVIFPLTLEKVVFVDADQIVRSDMKELWNIDLQGAPYGYTPMCDNNKEMEGFRFWKQGFWKNHLRGKPYHISALYVVDLKRFRELAAGDQLRGMYDQLSKDPGSLANLDQDLPNFAQHQVPIFSLPMAWLWCESWCGNETKSEAKTIDLCNNPLTKEPKLVGAARIVSEWTELDNEVRSYTATLEKSTSTSSSSSKNKRDEL